MDKHRNLTPDDLLVHCLAEAVADRELPDAEVGELFLGLAIAAEAKSRGVSFDEISENLKRDIVEKLRSAEANKAKNSTVEKALHKAIDGDPAMAGRIMREHMIDGVFNMVARDEAATQRRWRERISSKRRGDLLSNLIYELVRESGGQLSESELLQKLKSGGDKTYWKIKVKNKLVKVIDEIADDEIWYITPDGTGGRSAKISNLRGRLSRAKKKYNENSSR